MGRLGGLWRGCCAVRGPIVVINPNSNSAVTDGISEALERIRFADGPDIECLTLAEGPFGIESQADSDAVIVPQLALMRTRPDASAFVIACYSDPGLETAREQLSQPCLLYTSDAADD